MNNPNMYSNNNITNNPLPNIIDWRITWNDTVENYIESNINNLTFTPWIQDDNTLAGTGSGSWLINRRRLFLSLLLDYRQIVEEVMNTIPTNTMRNTVGIGDCPVRRVLWIIYGITAA